MSEITSAVADAMSRLRPTAATAGDPTEAAAAVQGVLDAAQPEPKRTRKKALPKTDGLTYAEAVAAGDEIIANGGPAETVRMPTGGIVPPYIAEKLPATAPQTGQLSWGAPPCEPAPTLPSRNVCPQCDQGGHVCAGCDAVIGHGETCQPCLDVVEAPKTGLLAAEIARVAASLVIWSDGSEHPDVTLAGADLPERITLDDYRAQLDAADVLLSDTPGWVADGPWQVSAWSAFSVTFTRPVRRVS